MYRFMKCFFMLLVALLLGPATANAFSTLSDDAVRNYDENVVQANVVNVPSVTGGLDVSAFTADVAAAWDSDLGGVIDFDNSTLTFDAADDLQRFNEIVATYGASASGKTITLTTADGSGLDNLGENGSRGSLAISGPRNLRKDCSEGPCTNDYYFDIATSDGSVVTSMGLTALGRDNNDLRYTAKAFFNDGSSFETSLDQVKEDAGVQGTDDTFFGIAAPAGLWITQFALVNSGLNNLSGGFGHIDDIGFVTTEIPEPSSIVLLLGSLATVSLGNRRKR